MNDSELLDLIADRAPTPAADYADHMVAAGRRVRTRRRRLVVAGVALCAAVTVAVPVVGSNVIGGSSGQEVTAVKSPPADADQAAVYDTAISAILSDAMPAATIAEYYLVDQLCANVLSPGKPCQGEPFPAGVRRQLEELNHRQVHFVPVDTNVPEPGILITLGPIRWARADLAEVPISFEQRPESGRGHTYRIELRDGAWQSTGLADGQHWIN
jgi:hypothetical protein